METSDLTSTLFKWLLVFGGAALFMATFVAFSASKAHTSHVPAETLTREAVAWEMIADGALLVDVRTPAEFESGHLDGALNISHELTAQRIAEYGDDKSRPIVVYCRSGNRSGQALKVLVELGFTGVRNWQVN